MCVCVCKCVGVHTVIIVGYVIRVGSTLSLLVHGDLAGGQ